MFTQPMSSPPTGPQSTTTLSPSRPSRLRGLSYLRNYTHNHILSRDATTSSTTTTTTTTANNTSTTSPRQSGPTGNPLTRSVSYTPSSTTPPNHHRQNSDRAPNTHRLTLVSSNPDQSVPRSAQRQTVSQTSQPIAESADSGGVAPQSEPEQPVMTRREASPTAEAASTSDSMPSIRFSAYFDPRSSRPSLTFSPISRTLSNGKEIIRVGRYSERDGGGNSNSNQTAGGPVGFKSKVVSRRHCEFWSENGKWFIKDVKSSSGTFLNHIRLSPPSQESKAFPVSDGDVVQLGIDFKGGEEMIFRCVKMRLELNRGWQAKPNTFNMAAHKRLRTMTAPNASMSGSSSQDCSICLMAIAPCQALFVAPCFHTWHFKCIRSLLTSPSYPVFICPNCRAGADLEADVDEPSEEWQVLAEQDEDEEQKSSINGNSATSEGNESVAEQADATVLNSDAMDVTVTMNTDTQGGQNIKSSHTTVQPLPIRNPASGSGRGMAAASPPATGAEGPITPRNDAGPWVFDGTGGRRAIDPTAEMRSLDAAAEMDLTGNEHSDDSSR